VKECAELKTILAVVLERMTDFSLPSCLQYLKTIARQSENNGAVSYFPALVRNIGKEGFVLDDVRVLYEDKELNLWAGLAKNGVVRYKPSGAVEHFLGNNSVKSLYQDFSGIWAGNDKNNRIQLFDGFSFKTPPQFQNIDPVAIELLPAQVKEMLHLELLAAGFIFGMES